METILQSRYFEKYSYKYVYQNEREERDKKIKI